MALADPPAEFISDGGAPPVAQTEVVRDRR
jgi:hypothetical protein